MFIVHNDNRKAVSCNRKLKNVTTIIQNFGLFMMSFINFKKFVCQYL